MSAVAFLNGYDVVICKQCGLGFADDIPRQDVFDRYYQDNSKYEYQHTGGKESESDESRFRAIAETLARSVAAKSSRVLEIGCATGRLLALLRDAGFANVQGLDPSPGCAQAAWDLYKVPVFAGSLFSIPASSNAYDLVISVGVLEHVEDTSKALDCIRAVLSPEGLVYAEVPDGSRYAGRPDAPYQEFSIEHINFFSTVSLSTYSAETAFALFPLVRPSGSRTRTRPAPRRLESSKKPTGLCPSNGMKLQSPVFGATSRNQQAWMPVSGA